jgi:L-fucose isomerase-like protein
MMLQTMLSLFGVKNVVLDNEAIVRKTGNLSVNQTLLNESKILISKSYKNEII